MTDMQQPPNAGEGEDKSVTDAHQPEEEERLFTSSITEEDRNRSFEFEDARWAVDKQISDWLKLLLMIAIYIGWSLLVYILEPGLR